MYCNPFHILKLIVLTALLAVSCRSKDQSAELTEPEEFPVTTVIKRNISIPLEYVANIQAFQNIEVRARVEGYLEEILVDEGKEVKKGQLLFKINEDEYRADLNRARANVISAEAETKSALVELERVRLLVNKNVITKTELDLAEAKVEIARSRVEQAKAEEVAASIRLANTSIRSPFNGIIDRIPFKIGSLISAGALLTTLSDIETVNAYFNVSEVEYLMNFSKAKSRNEFYLSNVELILADGTLYPLKGTIETMESEFEVGTGAIAVRAKFQNPNRLLKHGSTGKIRLQDTRNGALLLPQKSGIEIQDKNYVYLLNANQTLGLKSFVPIGRLGDFYVVGSGLTESDQFVYEGIQNVREGMVIKPRAVTADELLRENTLNQ
ncbi:MAG: efflux RND transporter periplasmic adaptor subunit [Cyclobacteriaceae bacterium]|nr:efflux RND transporter periplasmic adaptor subunit [Cyclobacteriaceae bacterium]UYN85313.1 MAG: efflux RND transporter periplasmic adaptor subunit [Cyclobacteriaceae bacterium]